MINGLIRLLDGRKENIFLFVLDHPKNNQRFLYSLQKPCCKFLEIMLDHQLVPLNFSLTDDLHIFTNVQWLYLETKTLVKITYDSKCFPLEAEKLPFTLFRVVESYTLRKSYLM